MIRHFLQIFKKGNNSALKIILLGAGIAMGLILIAKIYYERAYDNFMDNPDRIYTIMYDYSGKEDTKARSYQHTPGAVAPGIKAYSSSVEAATRATSLFIEEVAVKILDKNGSISEGQYTARLPILADSSFFEIFTREISGNDPKEALNVKDHIYISRSLAKNISPANPDGLIGSMLFPVYMADGELKLVIDGIYEDFPGNSSFKNVDIIISMPTIERFSWDGSNNWEGNDRYMSFVKLFPGYTAKDTDKGIAEMCEKNLPLEQLQEAGVTISFHLESLSTYNIKNPDTWQTCLNLFILAVLVLTASVLNYVLIAISAMVHKSKMIAVHKCYGASGSNIYKMVFSETFVHIFLSVILSCFIIFAFRSNIELLVGTPISGLITPGSMIVLSGICLLIFFICGFLPGMAYSGIPVATAFRRYKENSRKWKLLLLFLQFAASTFLLSLLAVVILQYYYLVNSDIGYKYQNLAIVNLQGGYENKKESIMNEIRKLPFVEGATLSSSIPISGQQSGNNIYLPGEKKEYFNVADMYFAGKGYFDIMGIKIIDGRNFNEDAAISNEVMVSRSFVKKMEEMAGWKDGAIGKNILISEHSQTTDNVFTICGVYEDYVLGSYQGISQGVRDTRPSIQFYASEKYMQKEEMAWAYQVMNWLTVKLLEITPENLSAIEQIIYDANPNIKNKVTAYSDEVIMSYKESKRFKDSVTISGVIVLIITLIGLMGYSQDEINRRRSEIAIRKINGATVSELMKLFLNNVVKLALPAIVIGSVLAYFVAGNWLEMYTKKITLGWYIFALSGTAILIIVLATVALRTYSAANANPTKNLKNE